MKNEGLGESGRTLVEQNLITEGNEEAWLNKTVQQDYTSQPVMDRPFSVLS